MRGLPPVALDCRRLRRPSPKQKSKRGKVASRPSPKLTLEQLQVGAYYARAARFPAGLALALMGRARRPAARARAGCAWQAPASRGPRTVLEAHPHTHTKHALPLQADQQQYEEQLRQRQAAASAPSSSAAAGDDDSEYELQLGGGGRPSSAVEYGSTAAVPEVVTDRMLKRVIIFMGTPVFGGVLLFPLFYYLKARRGGRLLTPLQRLHELRGCRRRRRRRRRRRKAPGCSGGWACQAAGLPLRPVTSSPLDPLSSATPFPRGLQVKQGLDLPNWVAYLSSSLTFGGGLLGISYGIMSGAPGRRRASCVIRLCFVCCVRGGGRGPAGARAASPV